MDGSKLTLPLVLWHGPPSHDITAIEISSCSGVLVTGASSGHLCVWRLDSAASSDLAAPEDEPLLLEPLLVLVGHRAPIVALQVSMDSWRREVVFSLCSDGSMASWALVTGRSAPLRAPRESM